MLPKQTQSQNSKQTQTCDIIIGLDFGTSCTKVVLQSPYFADHRTMLVSFGNLGHPLNNHFLPTRVFYDAQGTCSLCAEKNTIPATGLKLRLLQNPDCSESLSDFKVSPRTLAIAYLALVFRVVRRWFLETQNEIYGHLQSRWKCNVGIPSPGYDDTNIKELFRNIAIDAWRFSLGDETISLAQIWRYLGGNFRLNHKLDIHPDDIQVLPEIVAEVAGYAKSHLRENGLHVLIDIGASTIDISGFILHDQEGEDCYSFLTSDLEHLGAYYCHMERVRRVKEYVQRWFAHLASRQDFIMPIALSLAEYFPKLDDFGVNAEKELVEEFYRRCRSLIHRTLKSLRKDRDPKSPQWDVGLPIFLSGGGKSLMVYQQVLEDLNQYWQTSMATHGFEIRNLPVPKNLIADELNEKIFDRFAVAYGLSFPYCDVGEIRPPSEIENIVADRTPKYGHIEYISKDLV